MTTYKLFAGFRKLGEFNSIFVAKRYAYESGITGVFNLIGTNGYRDSWYVFVKHEHKTTGNRTKDEGHPVASRETEDSETTAGTF